MSPAARYEVGPDATRTAVGRRVSRLPLRARLVAAFPAARLVVLAGAGTSISGRVQFALDKRLDTDLIAKASVARPLVQPDGTLAVSESAPAGGVSDYQVLDARGRVLSASPGLGRRKLLGPAALRAVRVRPIYREVGDLLAGLGTLLVTSVVGERLARAALAPAERYRSEARAIAAGGSRLRLDVPPTGRTRSPAWERP